MDVEHRARKISSVCYDERIKKRTQLAIFKKTVFGHFVDMDVIFNGPVVHYILSREVKDNRKGGGCTIISYICN